MVIGDWAVGQCAVIELRCVELLKLSLTEAAHENAW